MGELFNGISAVLSFITTLVFWGGMVLIIAMLRKVTKDLADLKKSVAALEQTAMPALPPEVPAPSTRD